MFSKWISSLAKHLASSSLNPTSARVSRKCFEFFNCYLGMALSGPIKDRIGYIGNFSLSIVFALSAMFWAIFLLKVIFSKPA